MELNKNITRKRLARRVLFGLLVTFILLRALVYFIMIHQDNNDYVFLKGVHIHHFDEGILLIAFIAGYTLFSSKKKQKLEWIAVLYGVALALIFDEFGMWLRLTVTYWQKISVNIIFIISTFFGILAYVPSWHELNIKRRIILVMTVLGFIATMHFIAAYIRKDYALTLQQLNHSYIPECEADLRPH